MFISKQNVHVNEPRVPRNFFDIKPEVCILDIRDIKSVHDYFASARFNAFLQLILIIKAY